MGFRTITALVIILIIVILIYLVIDHCRQTVDNAWKVILTQPLPRYIRTNPTLVDLFNEKMKERKFSRISIANLLFTYISSRGILGDTSWHHFEDFCKMAVQKIPITVSKKIDAIVSIASGGAFIGPIVAKCLNIPSSNVHVVHISKWSSAKTLVARARLYTSEEKNIRVTVKKGLTRGDRLFGKHVLIVDDQACSGSTIRKCIDLVRKCNASSIHTMALASSCQLPINGVDTVGYEGFIFMWPFGVDS